MATKKITISLPEDLVEEITKWSKATGVPVSTWIAEAAKDKARIEDGLAALREWDEMDGPLTPEELAAADEKLARADAELLRGRRRAS
jgi:cytosine/adenosine deaminase-related metal-dependent hydrolase